MGPWDSMLLSLPKAPEAGACPSFAVMLAEGLGVSRSMNRPRNTAFRSNTSEASARALRSQSDRDNGSDALGHELGWPDSSHLTPAVWRGRLDATPSAAFEAFLSWASSALRYHSTGGMIRGRVRWRGARRPVSTPCPPNRTCGSPASGSPVGSCNSHTERQFGAASSHRRSPAVPVALCALGSRKLHGSTAVPLSDAPPDLFTP